MLQQYIVPTSSPGLLARLRRYSKSTHRSPPRSADSVSARFVQLLAAYMLMMCVDKRPRGVFSATHTTDVLSLWTLRL
eukprot:662114-Pyramimonas_sp.AAC.2